MAQAWHELAPGEDFIPRHIGPSDQDVASMLQTLGLGSLDELIEKTVPSSIRDLKQLDIPAPRSEREALAALRAHAARNRVCRSFIGLGYAATFVPPVIQRNVLENPGWYTQYTPYQPEISQGRLEALLNFQTMIADLTGLDIANASMLDEGTAAAEAMALSLSVSKLGGEPAFLVSPTCHPQTIEVVETRAAAVGVRVIVADHATVDFATQPVFGVLVSYPTTDGRLLDYTDLCARAHAASALVTVVADPLALTLLRTPGEMGADIVVGNSQRFGVPLGFGGPHAAFFATRDAYKRQLPGRLVGVSVDTDGNPAYRLALQTREQHIRRERATSNICTAQVLLAVMASMYAVWHGPHGLRRIAARVRHLTTALASGLTELGLEVAPGPYFDTLRVPLGVDAQAGVGQRSRAAGVNFRAYGDGVGIALDETTTADELTLVCRLLSGRDALPFTAEDLVERATEELPAELARTTPLLTHPVFNTHHSETEMLRYMRRLESRDLSLTTCMIPLGSCTMKLNASAEMFPVSWPEFSSIHPFAPHEQTTGYRQMIAELEGWLSALTGFAATSIQPNAGSQGEYAGLLVIRKYHESRGEGHRRVCLIPSSAHGTNPASAIMAGLEVVVVKCDTDGNVDLDDLRARASQHSPNLAALMVTYPSTHGVFEESIREICDLVHTNGGQVYMDGANMNAQIGVARPGEFGPDVCHLNLHKTFCIPHGGGGPGVGPICVREHLVPFLPGSRLAGIGGEQSIGAISAAPYGSASILPISWMYIAMMGAKGLRRATDVAILNANYIAKRLAGYYDVVYKGRNGFVAHECILDMRPHKDGTDITVEDIAKRLMDYGFHAPTMSWPVAGTLMIEPTESESKFELDRFCDAMIAIHAEIDEIRQGRADRKTNLLKSAPHTARAVTGDTWQRPYSRERAAFPSKDTRSHKYWPPVGRIDNAYGDRNLVCSCPPLEDYTE